MAVAAHGVIFAAAGMTLARVDAPGLEPLGVAYLFVVIAPALILALPFSPLLWHFHLMQTPGWFAWPKPAGFALVYATWVLVLFVLWRLARRRGVKP